MNIQDVATEMSAVGEGRGFPWDGKTVVYIDGATATDLSGFGLKETGRVVADGDPGLLGLMTGLGWRVVDYRPLGDGIRILASPPRVFSVPRWAGEKCRVLVHSDRGFGDEFYHLRYLGLASRMAELVYESHSSMRRLVSSLGIPALEIGGPLPRFDRHIDICNLKDVVGEVPVEVYLGGVELGRRVGCCWMGSRIKVGERRVFPEEHFRTWSKRVPMVSFQRGCPVSWAESGAGEDWLATMHRLRSCRLLITVDTAMAHLAGAMGLVVWVLYPLPYPLFYGDDSYPRMRFVRGSVAEIVDWATRRIWHLGESGLNFI